MKTKREVCNAIIAVLQRVAPELYDQNESPFTKDGCGCVWAHLTGDSELQGYLRISVTDPSRLFSNDEIYFIIDTAEKIQMHGKKLGIPSDSYGISTVYDAMQRVKIISEPR